MSEADLALLEMAADGATQTEIARALGFAQPSICYRLQRLTERVGRLAELEELMSPGVWDAAETIQDPLNRELCLDLLTELVPTRVAAKKGISQGKVRHRLLQERAGLGASENELALAGVLDFIFEHSSALRDGRHVSR